MDWKGLYRILLSQHAGKSQEEEKIRRAIHSAEEALSQLSALGHIFHLEEGPGASYAAWPKILFHISSAPNGRVVNSPWDAEDLGPGWYETSEAAQTAHGIEVQFALRGGIHRRSLPSVIGPGVSPDDKLAEKSVQSEKIKALRAANSSKGKSNAPL